MLLEVQDLELKRGERRLFQNLSWQVRPGEFWVLEGASGLGKTSLLKVLSGEIACSGGSFRRHQDWAEIPQHASLNDELSALINAGLGTFKHQSFWTHFGFLSGELKKQIKEDLRHWGIQNPDQRTGDLSGGEKQRVGLSRVRFERWKLLFADEPISQLDETNARLALRFLKAEMQKRQGAVIAVLHHQNLIQEFATHRLNLSDFSGRDA